MGELLLDLGLALRGRDRRDRARRSRSRLPVFSCSPGTPEPASSAIAASVGILRRHDERDEAALAMADERDPLRVDAGLFAQPRDLGLDVVGLVERGRLVEVTGRRADAAIVDAQHGDARATERVGDVAKRRVGRGAFVALVLGDSG